MTVNNDTPTGRRIAVTGANGFLGLHVRAALQEQGIETVSVGLGANFDEDAAVAAVDGAEAVMHLAGVNRGTDDEIAEGNYTFARQVAGALKKADSPPARLVYANSIQAGNNTPYGTAKREAGVYLTRIANAWEADFVDVALPNLFGEYGRPFYNSVVATFCHLVAIGDEPTIVEDKELTLLHVADAADLLIGTVPLSQMDILVHRETVSEVARLLKEFAALYRRTEIPNLSTPFRRNLFNTYRSYLYPDRPTVPVTVHRDHRGGFFEITRSRGGTGQTSFSTTAPGVSRGDHYHRRKVERFTVVSGIAEISLRRFDQDTTHTLRVGGDEPVSVDMPTLVAHDIRNVGDGMLSTVFWTNDIFDPTNPDTISEVVK